MKAAGYSWLEGRLPALGEEPIRPGKSIRLGGYFYGMSEEEWPWAERREWIGRHFDLYSAMPQSREDFFALRPANPALCLLLMFCPVILSVGPGGGLSVGGLDPERMAGWRLLTKEGAEAPNTLWGTKDLGRLTSFMDIGNKEWAEFFRRRANLLCRLYGADGYCIDGVPWNGVYYLQPQVELRDYSSGAQVNAAIYRFLDAVRAPHPFLVLDDVTSPEQQAHLDGVWGEDWLAYDASLPFGDDRTARWEQAVENVERYSAQRKPYIAAGWYHYGRDNELDYLLATYLLAKRSNSVVFQPQPMGSGLVGPPKHAYDLGGYHIGLARQEIEAHRALLDVELGAPLAGRERRPGAEAVWQRRFRQGLVLVNASLRETATVPLRRRMRRAGGEVVSAVTLAPRSGAILLAVP